MLTQVAQSKSYSSPIKIGIYRKGKHKTANGWAAKSIRSLHVFEKENMLSFSIREANLNNKFYTAFVYKLKVYKNKQNETKFIFYVCSSTGFDIKEKQTYKIRTSSPNHFRTTLSNSVRNNKIPKVHIDRLYKTLKSFLKKHNVDTKYLSKDPFNLMLQLCYPGTKIIKNDSILQSLKPCKFLLGDINKLVCNTRGKTTTKLLYQIIEKHPYAAPSIFKIAKFYSIHKSLDDAQKFLIEILNLNRTVPIYDWEFFTPIYNSNITSIDRLPIKYLMFLKNIPTIGPNSFVNSLKRYTRSYMSDIITMFHELIDPVNQNGFNINDAEYKSIEEFHDILVNLHADRNRKNKEIKHYDFKTNEKPMQICNAIENNFNQLNSKYVFVYPKNTEELLEMSNDLHNCSYYYKEKINSGNYLIFCIQVENKNTYMFGYTINNLYITGTQIKLDQAVTYCNQFIESNDMIDIQNLLNQSVNNQDLFSIA